MSRQKASDGEKAYQEWDDYRCWGRVGTSKLAFYFLSWRALQFTPIANHCLWTSMFWDMGQFGRESRAHLLKTVTMTNCDIEIILLLSYGVEVYRWNKKRDNGRNGKHGLALSNTCYVINMRPWPEDCGTK